MVGSVTSGDFTLTDEQRGFKKMPYSYPLMASYWNFEQRECDLQAI